MSPRSRISRETVSHASPSEALSTTTIDMPRRYLPQRDVMSRGLELPTRSRLSVLVPGRPGRLAHDEPRRELDVQRLEALALEEPHQQADRRTPHLGERLADRRERRGDDGRVLDVVEADDREILGDPEARVRERPASRRSRGCR